MKEFLAEQHGGKKYHDDKLKTTKLQCTMHILTICIHNNK